MKAIIVKYVANSSKGSSTFIHMPRGGRKGRGEEGLGKGSCEKKLWGTYLP